MKEVRLHGRGGQGVAMLAEMLVTAFVKEGKFASGFPMFGVERRGAPVTSYVRYDDKPIRVRTRVYKPDCIIVLDSTLITEKAVFAGFKPGGMILLNMPKAPQQIYDLKPGLIGLVDATSIAVEVLDADIANTAVLGAFAGCSGDLGLPAALQTIEEYFQGPLQDKNKTCVERGFQKAVRTIEMDNRTGPVSPGVAQEGKAVPPVSTSFRESRFNTSWVDGATEDLWVVDTGQWRYQRPELSTKKCCQCGWCSLVCPVNCLQADDAGYFRPDWDFCKGCGMCAYECPRNAISMVREKKVI